VGCVGDQALLLQWHLIKIKVAVLLEKPHTHQEKQQHLLINALKTSLDLRTKQRHTGSTTEEVAWPACRYVFVSTILCNHVYLKFLPRMPKPQQKIACSVLLAMATRFMGASPTHSRAPYYTQCQVPFYIAVEKVSSLKFRFRASKFYF
jgi:hypothetical protein